MDETKRLTIIKSRGPGRPKAEVPGIPLTTWIPTPLYDRICRLAHERDQTVSACVKSLLILRLK